MKIESYNVRHVIDQKKHTMDTRMHAWLPLQSFSKLTYLFTFFSFYNLERTIGRLDDKLWQQSKEIFVFDQLPAQLIFIRCYYYWFYFCF